MAKKTLESLKKCPIDFLYLWASDGFISELGSKAKIIKQKKYNQQQTLWKAMADNEKFSSSAEGQVLYDKWAKEIGEAIKETYGITPQEILRQLALGKTVLGKNFAQGVYGVGDTQVTTFYNTEDYRIDPIDGYITDADGNEVCGQTTIWGEDGNPIGYSCVIGAVQYQSYLSQDGMWQAYSTSTVDGVYTATGDRLDESKSTFWQNANNYMPIVNSILNWVSSLVSNYFPNNYLLTQRNTVPTQSEWIEEDNTGLYVAGGLALAGIAVLTLGKKRKKGN